MKIPQQLWVSWKHEYVNDEFLLFGIFGIFGFVHAHGVNSHLQWSWEHDDQHDDKALTTRAVPLFLAKSFEAQRTWDSPFGLCWNWCCRDLGIYWECTLLNQWYNQMYIYSHDYIIIQHNYYTIYIHVFFGRSIDLPPIRGAVLQSWGQWHRPWPSLRHTEGELHPPGGLYQVELGRAVVSGRFSEGFPTLDIWDFPVLVDLLFKFYLRSAGGHYRITFSKP